MGMANTKPGQCVLETHNCRGNDRFDNRAAARALTIHVIAYFYAKYDTVI